MKKTIALMTALGALAVVPAAQATISSVLGGAVSCTVQTGGNAGERHCSGIYNSFDGAPIDVNIGFPPEPGSGPDGNFPIIGLFHGWGGAKESLTGGTMQQWIDAGYAVFSMSDRGWGLSCGGTDPKRLMPGVCDNGYNHLMDTRYEVRDAQEVFEALADQLATGATSNEGLIDPQAIGSAGSSYGGGISMALGALKNRKMLGAHEAAPNPPNPVPNLDGYLVPWVSDGGKAMQIAAVQPDIPWTDLAYSLQPNGHTLDYVDDAQYLQRGRIGVMKQSFVAGLYALGLATSNYAPAGTDPDANLTQWYASINAGEPYDQDPLSQDVVDEVTRHHSSYYIDDSTAPAPMLITNGFTDDLFPPDEPVRFYNRTRTNHPGTPISLIFSDHGHQRGQNKGPDGTFRNNERHAWFDFYLKGIGSQPFLGVRTLTQTCPASAPSVGASGDFDDPINDSPFAASTWASFAPGEVRVEDVALKVIASSVPSDGPVGTAFDPIATNDPCATASATDQTGAASYRSAAIPAGGFTMMGSATVVADILNVGPNSQIAARLLDVDPTNTNETLVARGLYRPEVQTLITTCQVFQLHPNGWKFDTGHFVKLELLPADQPYGRNSNGQTPITVSNLKLRLPVLESPGALSGLVQSPSTKVLPVGYGLAADVTQGVDPGCVPGSVPTVTPTPTFTPPPTLTPTPTISPTPRPGCGATTLCGSAPTSGCRRPVEADKASLVIKNKTPDDRDLVSWRWRKGAATTKADYGMPLSTTDYEVCIYNGNNNLVSTACAPAGGLCGTKDCWRETVKGFKYRKRDIEQGLKNSLQVTLKEGAAGYASIGVKGKGTAPGIPALPITTPVTVQILNDNGFCWEAIYSDPVMQNDSSGFKDKSD